MSWLKKLWHQACEKQGNKIKTAGTHYAIFDLPFEPYALSEESQTKLRRLYLKMSTSGEYCHPDKKVGDEFKENKFDILSEAYTTLTDLSKKLAYDDAIFGEDHTDHMRITLYNTIDDYLDDDDELEEEESDCEELEEEESDEEESDEEESDEEESDEEESDEEESDEEESDEEESD